MRSTKQPVTSITAPFRRPSIRAGGCLAIAAVLTLSACGPDRAAPLPTPDDAAPAAAPVFASDAEALQAAVEVYAKYTAVSGEIAADTGADLERVEQYVTENNLPEVREGLEWFASNHIRSEGMPTFDTPALQSYVDTGDGTASISIYVCVDVASTRLIDAHGADVTPLDRRDRLPLLVEFLLEQPDPQQPRIADSSFWSGVDYCDL